MSNVYGKFAWYTSARDLISSGLNRDHNVVVDTSDALADKTYETS